MLTNEQLAARKNSIGGSDVAALLGLVPWKTPLDVYLEKTNEGPFEIKSLEHQQRLDAGNDLEPWVAKRFEKYTNKIVIPNPTTFKNPTYPFSHANLDGLISGENSGIELKTTDSSNIYKWPANGSTEIIKLYKPQLMHNRLIAGVERFYLAVCFGFSQFRWYLYEPTAQDLENEKALQELVQLFWEEHILKRIPPAPTSFEDVKKIYPTTDAKNIKVATDPQLYHAYETMKNCNEIIKIQEAIKDRAQTLLCGYIQDSEILEDSCGKKMSSWKNFDRDSIDYQKLKMYYPDVYQAVKKTSGYRLFKLH